MSTTSNLASVLSDEGLFAEAEALHRQSIETGSRVYGDKADMVGWYAGLGWLLFREGKTAEPDRLFQRALAICHALIGSGSVHEAQVLEKYSVLEAALGRYDAARSESTPRSRSTGRSSAFRRYHSRTLLSQRAEIGWKLGRNREAEDLFRQALEMGRSPAGRCDCRPLPTCSGTPDFWRERAALRAPNRWHAKRWRSGFGNGPRGFGTSTAPERARRCRDGAGPLLRSRAAGVGGLSQPEREARRGRAQSEAALQRVVRLYEAWGNRPGAGLPCGTAGVQPRRLLTNTMAAAPITELLHQARQEHRDADRRAHADCRPHDQLKRLAKSYLRGENSGHTLVATALVHEAYLRLAGSDVDWKDRVHFFAVAARQMRYILVRHAKLPAA